MVPGEVRVRVRARVCMNECMLQKYRESTPPSLYIYTSYIAILFHL